jgi:GT2 family glycosyltransferase
MSKFPRVAVVVLNYNGEKLLPEFLPSVYNSSYPNLRLVLADNASTDGSVEWVKANLPTFEILKNEINGGYAEGYQNIINKITDVDYYILLNSDVEVTENWIEPVIELMENNIDIAIAQPKILSYLDKKNFEYAGAAGGYIDKFGYPFCKGRIFDTVEKDENQYKGNTEIFWASGAAMFIKADVYHKSGGLDVDFFAHMEEIDLCWRIKNMGYKVYSCNASVVYHLGGATLHESNPHKTYLNFRNSLITLRKNLALHKSFSIIFIRHVLDLIQWIRFMLAGKFRHAFAINRAHYDFLITQITWHNKRKKLLKLFKSPNNTGIYNRSIVFDYFLLGKKTFNKLDPKKFY